MKHIVATLIILAVMLAGVMAEIKIEESYVKTTTETTAETTTETITEVTTESTTVELDAVHEYNRPELHVKRKFYTWQEVKDRLNGADQLRWDV